ncbi:MAG: hypothetical protein ACK4E7_02640 [Permianibacter sp.]
MQRDSARTFNGGAINDNDRGGGFLIDALDMGAGYDDAIFGSVFSNRNSGRNSEQSKNRVRNRLAAHLCKQHNYSCDWMIKTSVNTDESGGWLRQRRAI